jgi:hypothetical protein
MLKKAREENDDRQTCPLISSSWAQMIPSQKKPVIIGEQTIAEQPMANGVAEVPCPKNRSCSWWHEDGKQCAIQSILHCLDIMAFGDDDDDDTDGDEEQGNPSGGDGDGRIIRATEVSVDKG